jgi:hypothetical protein
MMDEANLTPHGRDIGGLKNASGGTGIMAGRSSKAPAKLAAKDKTPAWESAFHAERGCLDGGLPLRYNAPLPNH